MPDNTLGTMSIQERTLRIFTVLHYLRQDWGGGLIVACGLSPQGAALALASNVAGAVCLSIEQEVDVAHDVLRTGACDFVVNTLDEALRAMKNEVRKHLPLSVGLQGDQSAVLAELLERGVAPQLFTDLSGSVPGQVVQQFQIAGATIVDFSGQASSDAAFGHQAIPASEIVEAAIAKHNWHVESFLQVAPSALRAFDLRALNLIAADDTLRSKWLHAAPKILPRESPLHRTLWVTEAEKHQLQA